MTASWVRIAAVSGLIVCLAFLPMAVVIPKLPDLEQTSSIVDLYRQHSALMASVIIAATVGFGFLSIFLGGLVARLLDCPGASGALWTAVLSAVMFFIALNVSLGLAAAARLLQLRAGDTAVDTLHVGAFLLAAPAAGPGVAFFAAVGWLAFKTPALPRSLGWLALLGAVANLGPAAGPTMLGGPLNAGNGLVAGLAMPVLSFLAWIAATSVWLWRNPDADFGGRAHSISA